jgi:chemotaxis protein methyltransferase CheR
LKHAFPVLRPDAAILVSYKVAEKDWKLTISDNGVGKPDVKASQGKAGLGTSLIKALAKQLDAAVDITSDQHGTAVSMTHATFKAIPPQAMKKTFAPPGNSAMNLRVLSLFSITNCIRTNKSYCAVALR